MKKPQIFVLVHGAWHGGWCWRRVANSLSAAGHVVFTPTLTGLGERAHLVRPGITIDDGATDVVNVIKAEELEDVILVGHSYGGGPVSLVADRIPEALKHLVYLDATILFDGQSLFSTLHPTVVAERLKLAEESSGGLTIPPPAPGVFGVTDPRDAEWLRRRLTPQPVDCYRTPIRLNHPPGNGVKKTYISCTHPLYKPTRPAHDWAKSHKDWRYIELPCGHDAMVICPDALVEILMGCTEVK
jgi:pimeloyl-ACP methyl ester carboxylesterase